MKDFLKKSLKSILFFLIFCVFIFVFSWLFLPGNNIKQFGLYKVSAYEILGEEKDTIDVVVLGDSLVYSSLSPMEIWNEFGYTSFDCAESAQIIPDAYEYLKVAVESQHPKIVLMEANLLYRDPKKRKKEDQMSKKFENLIPIIKYHNNWKKYFSKEVQENWINVNKGFKYIDNVEPSTNKVYMKPTNKKSTFLKGNKDYFTKIVKLCEENNIKLVVVAFPTQNTWSYKKHHGIESLQEYYNFEFMDLNLVQDLNIDWEKDTRDGGNHLNVNGAKKVSLYIGNYLRETNLLIDHRQDQKYNSWNIAYKKYQKNFKE